jgi:hypothetical protein
MSDRMVDGRITGTAQTGCGAAEGGSVDLALDANDHVLIVHADGSWGNGGDAGWSLPSNAPDFSVQVCDKAAKNCETATKAHLVVKSSTSSAIHGRISYEILDRKSEFAFLASRTDIREPLQVCG